LNFDPFITTNWNANVWGGFAQRDDKSSIGALVGAVYDRARCSIKDTLKLGILRGHRLRLQRREIPLLCKALQAYTPNTRFLFHRYEATWKNRALDSIPPRREVS
jgi:hypothetical protein